MKKQQIESPSFAAIHSYMHVLKSQLESIFMDSCNMALAFSVYEYTGCSKLT